MEPRIFDNVSDISVRMSQLSSQSRPEIVSESEISSQRSQNIDSGVPQSSQTSKTRKSRKSGSQKTPRRPWDVYLSSKPLMPAGLTNSSRLTSGKRWSNEVIQIYHFFIFIE